MRKNKPKTTFTLTALLITGMVLPITVAFLFLFARILTMLGDVAFGSFLDSAAILLALVWLVDLVFLLFAIAVRLIVKDDDLP